MVIEQAIQQQHPNQGRVFQPFVFGRQDAVKLHAILKNAVDNVPASVESSFVINILPTVPFNPITLKNDQAANCDLFPDSNISSSAPLVPPHPDIR